MRMKKGASWLSVVPDKSVLAKIPSADPIDSLTEKYIVSDLRRDMNNGRFPRPAWAFSQLAACTSVLGDKVRFWEAQIGMWDWKIAMADDCTSAKAEPKKRKLAEKQKQVLVERYERIANIDEAITHLATARFYGFAALRWLDKGTYLFPVQPWNVIRDLETRGNTPPSGEWYWNPLAQTTLNKTTMTQMSPKDFILRECRRSSIIELLDLGFRYRTIMNFREKNLEAASKNQVIILTSQNLPPKDSLEFQEMKRAITDACNGDSVAIAKGDPSCPTEIHYGQAPAGLGCYDASLQQLEQQIAQTVSGGMLTMLALPTGIGSSVADQHAQTLGGLVLQECKEIRRVLQENIDIPALQEAGLLEEGGRPLAWFDFSGDEKRDPKKSAELLISLKAAGYRVSAEAASSLVGMELQDVDAQQAEAAKQAAAASGGEGGAGESGAGGGAKGAGDLENRGTSEGARKGWDTRIRNGWTPRQLADNKATVDSLIADLDKTGKDGKGKGWKNTPKDLGKISQALANDIRAANPNIQATVGTMQTIDQDRLNHALETHGVGKEKRRDQVPITKEDLARIPDVLSSYDEIVPGLGKAEGKRQEGVIFRKKYEDGTVCCVEIDWFRRGDKRQELKFQTMWKEKA